MTSDPTPTLTDHEVQQAERANATGRTPVVFVHGPWVLPSSWDRWAQVFEEAGYTALTPGWPDDPETVEEAKAHPEVFARKTVGQVADHFQAATANLNPWTDAKVDTETADRGPLLILSGEHDHTVPWAISHASYKRQERNEAVTAILEIPGRGHALTIDSSWREVCEIALRFVQRFVGPNDAPARMGAGEATAG